MGRLETATPPLVTGNLHIQGVRKRVDDLVQLQLATAFEVYGFRNGEAPSAPTQPRNLLRPGSRRGRRGTPAAGYLAGPPTERETD